MSLFVMIFNESMVNMKVLTICLIFLKNLIGFDEIMFFIVKELYSNKEGLEKNFVKFTCACSIPFFTKPNCYMVNYIGFMNNQKSNHFCNSAFKKSKKL